MKRGGLLLYVLSRLGMPAVMLGQGMPGMKMGTDPAGQAAHEAMAGKMASGAHMRMTELRAMTSADSVRAMAIADTLRRALAKYADPAAAERDGYKLFAPPLKNPKVYHYTNWKHALGEAFRFNPQKPTSILYTENASGKMQLAGAMYTMPKRASPAELDKRIPLSVTQWHLHTNLCVPRKGDKKRWTEVQNGKPLFGLAGTITTKSACDAENGRFTDVLFGWMVHANVFQGTDLKSVWGHDEMDERDHPHGGG
jgi:hypothetical protein